MAAMTTPKATRTPPPYVPGDWWQEPFLRALEGIPIVSRAARKVGITTRRVTRECSLNPEFRERVFAAKAVGIDRVETAAFQRAVKGVEKGVWHQGVRVGTEVVYSDTLLLAILKGYRKDIYTERTELTGAGGEPLVATLQDDTAKAARVAALLAIAAARKSSKDAPEGHQEPAGELPDLDDIV